MCSKVIISKEDYHSVSEFAYEVMDKLDTFAEVLRGQSAEEIDEVSVCA